MIFVFLFLIYFTLYECLYVLASANDTISFVFMAESYSTVKNIYMKCFTNLHVILVQGSC